MHFTIYSSNKQQDAKETYYPNKNVVKDEPTAIAAFTYDHVCGEYVNNHRSNEDFIRSDVICLDCDNSHTEDPLKWIDVDDYSEIFADYNYVLVPSRNNMKDKGSYSARPRHHIYFPITEIKDAGKYKDLKQKICKDFSFFDPKALDAAHFFYGHNVSEVVFHDGGLNLDFVYTKQPVTVAEGGRNNYMSVHAGRILKRLGDCDEAFETFMIESEKCVPPLDEEELKGIWSSALKFYERIKSDPNYVPPSEYNPDGLKPSDYSDIGQATVLVEELGNELKYTSATDFVVFDGVSWVENKQRAVGVTESFLNIQLADAKVKVKKAHQALVDEGVADEIIVKGGVKLINETNGSLACKAYLSAVEYEKFVLKRRDMKYVVSALQAAKPMVEIAPSDLDKNAYLLNCPNGTYDLHKGIDGFKEHDADDLITKVTSCAPGEDGEDLWQKTLDTIFQGGAELIEYVQNIVGMAAVGEVNLEAIIISYGDGSNGKSTFWNSVAAVLGSYSGKISADTLTVGNTRNVKPELAEAKGKRLLIASELKEGVRLDTSMVKQLCSTDEIVAEKKYKDPFSFVPSHTLVLYTNHLPKVGATDEGIWRRLIVIPFTATIRGKNKNYTNVLIKKASPAIMKWIIEGAEKIIKNDFQLNTPQCVKEAIHDYRLSNDWMSHFLEDCCVVDDKLNTPSGALYKAYREYCLNSKEYTRSTTDFYRELEKRGCIRKKIQGKRYIMGLDLKDEIKSETLGLAP